MRARRFFGIVFRDPVCCFCVICLGFFAFFAVFAPLFAPNDPNEIHFMEKFAGISRRFPLGTDHMGRCLLSRLLYGARPSLGCAALITAVSAAVGTIAGVMSGYFGGWADRVLMAVCDTVRSFPGVVIVLVAVSILGNGLSGLCIAMISTRWVWYARVARNLTWARRGRTSITASRMAGSSHWQIIKEQIFPSIFVEMLSVLTVNFGTALTALAGYSFLGFGAAPPDPEWGMMIQDGRAFISTNPSMIFWPGFAVLLVVLLTNLLGDRLGELAERASR